jgi:nucleotide-binding universal stress UspA family protein
MTAFTRILCPVDFSECSRHAPDEAIAIAHLFDGCVTALHVFPIAIPADPFGGLPDFQPFRLTDRHRARILRQLSAFTTAEGAESQHVTVSLREGVDIDAEILEAANQMKPDVIVMGTHGRSGFQHVMLGSVAESASQSELSGADRAPESARSGSHRSSAFRADSLRRRLFGVLFDRAPLRDGACVASGRAPGRTQRRAVDSDVRIDWRGTVVLPGPAR